MNEKEELLEISNKIEQQEKAIWYETKALEDAQAEVDLEMAKLRQDIATEKDLVSGKAAYTNESARGTALKMAIEKNEELQISMKDIRTERTATKIKEIELSSILRKFSVLKRLLAPSRIVDVGAEK